MTSNPHRRGAWSGCLHTAWRVALAGSALAGCPSIADEAAQEPSNAAGLTATATPSNTGPAGASPAFAPEPDQRTAAGKAAVVPNPAAADVPAVPVAGQSAAATSLPAPEPMSCLLVESRSVHPNAGHATLAAAANKLWLAAHTKTATGHNLLRFSITEGGALDALTPLALDTVGGPPLGAAPAIAVSPDGSLWLAAIDARGKLLVTADASAEQPTLRTIAEHLDQRFPPALRVTARHGLLAWTTGNEKGMHVNAARLRGKKLTTFEVTPDGHGATAPTFVQGRDEATLMMLDAHSGVSPLLEVTFSAAGEPAPAVVRPPVSQPSQPASIAAVGQPARHAQPGQPDGSVQVAYAAIGKLATSAVGIVRTDKMQPPQALLAGSGYGRLSVVAATGPARAVFAMDAPQGSEPAADLKVTVRVWDGQRMGPALSVVGKGGSARRPALAFDRSRGLFALAYLEKEQLWLSWLRCDA